ncbi:MAG: hypothetical protein WCP19_03640 [Chloroflexota bacterium]
MENYLVDNYNINNFTFTKPKKHGDYLVGKIKNEKENNIFVQFPRMKVVSQENDVIELEFIHESGYSKKVYNFLSELDNYIVDYVTEKSEEWFGKKISTVKQMYNNFIKAPKTTEDKCTVRINKGKGEIIYKKQVVDSVEKDDNMESIVQFKYIVFSKTFLSDEKALGKIKTESLLILINSEIYFYTSILPII